VWVSGAPRLYAAAPVSVESLLLCLDERDACLSGAATIGTKRVRTSGGRAIFEALKAPKLAAKGHVTVFAAKKGTATPDAASPFVSLRVERQ
jgi:hypothetical protein